MNLPITELTDDSCLVIVWATNKQSQLQFIQETLFPAWGVKYLAHWVWLKVLIFLTLKVPIMTAADNKFIDIFPNI